MTIPPFIEQLVYAGIPVTLQLASVGAFAFRLVGFYKSSGITITENEPGYWLATARYNETTRIECLLDIVGLNYYWWQRSKERSEGWAQPDEKWVPLLLKGDFIKEKVIPEQKVYE
jgi:hypothetical protein